MKVLSVITVKTIVTVPLAMALHHICRLMLSRGSCKALADVNLFNRCDIFNVFRYKQPVGYYRLATKSDKKMCNR